MLAKKFALAFGLAVILPMMVHYGVNVFSPLPAKHDAHWYDAEMERYQDASKGDEASMKRDMRDKYDERRRAESIHKKHLFFTAAPVGLLAILIGSVLTVQAVGAGLMFGGIFTLVDGYFWYWRDLPDLWRFLSLAAGFVLLIVIGIKKIGSR